MDAVPMIRITGVPEEVYARLQSQSAACGQSLNDFMLGRLADIARTRTVASWPIRSPGTRATTGPECAPSCAMTATGGDRVALVA
jgi:hypothetical protein